MNNFTNSLIQWFLEHKRNLPWRNTKDPYKIWLSEIILQQTRVDQGLPYYLKFVEQYPTVNDLAMAADDDVMKLWQGLGYYSRARNLLSTARNIQLNYKGKFPNDYNELRSLKGIGDYTAAAIASFAFKLKTPVLDGNVYRFITRLYGIETPIDKGETKNAVMLVLNDLIKDTQHPDIFNQALMEFGALCCTPKNPNCESCPFRMSCYALKENKIDLLPVKGKAIKVRDRYLNYFVFVINGKTTYIKKREGKDVWQNLYDFPLIETTALKNEKKLFQEALYKKWIKGKKVQKIVSLKPVHHKLSHQNLWVTFHVVELTEFLNLENNHIFDIEINTLSSFAVPRVIDKFLHSYIFKHY